MPLPSERVLLVEGRDDREVIYQFCNHHEIDNRSLFKVVPASSVQELLQGLAVRPKSSGLSVLAAVMDADGDIDKRWTQVRGAVKSHGYDLPTAPSPNGTICESPGPTRPRLGLWLMPNNETQGMLEDFLLKLVVDDDPLLKSARVAVAAIPKDQRQFGPTKNTKAVLHTMLAWQAEPGTPMGQAITKRYLDPTRDPAPAFEAWLRDLFVLVE